MGATLLEYLYLLPEARWLRRVEYIIHHRSRVEYTPMSLSWVIEALAPARQSLMHCYINIIYRPMGHDSAGLTVTRVTLSWWFPYLRFFFLFFFKAGRQCNADYIVLQRPPRESYRRYSIWRSMTKLVINLSNHIFVYRIQQRESHACHTGKRNLQCPRYTVTDGIYICNIYVNEIGVPTLRGRYTYSLAKQKDFQNWEVKYIRSYKHKSLLVQ